MHDNVIWSGMAYDRTPLVYVARREYRIPTFSFFMLTEKDIKIFPCRMTKKCYLMLKAIHGKEFAIESVKLSPFFKKNANF